jgi:hypothetical protein
MSIRSSDPMESTRKDIVAREKAAGEKKKSREARRREID